MPSWQNDLASAPCQVAAVFPGGKILERHIFLSDPNMARFAEVVTRQSLTDGWAWTWQTIEKGLMEIGPLLFGDLVEAHREGAGLLFRPPAILRHLSLPLLLFSAHSHAIKSPTGCSDLENRLTSAGLSSLVRAGPFRYVHWTEPPLANILEEKEIFGGCVTSDTISCLMAHGVNPVMVAADNHYIGAREEIAFFWRAFGDTIAAIQQLAEERGALAVAPWGWHGLWKEQVSACLKRRHVIVAAHAVRSKRGGNKSLTGVPRLGNCWPALAPAYNPARYKLQVRAPENPQQTVRLTDLLSHVWAAGGMRQLVLMACESRAPCEQLMAGGRASIRVQGRPIPIGIEHIYRGIQELFSGVHTAALLGVPTYDYLNGTTDFFTATETAALVAWWSSMQIGSSQ